MNVSNFSNDKLLSTWPKPKKWFFRFLKFIYRSKFINFGIKWIHNEISWIVEWYPMDAVAV